MRVARLAKIRLPDIETSCCELSILRQALEFSYSLSPEGREALRKIDAAIRGDCSPTFEAPNDPAL